MKSVKASFNYVRHYVEVFDTMCHVQRKEILMVFYDEIYKKYGADMTI